MGFSYREWVEAFYPASLKQGDFLSWYARYFDAVELDTTFHATPSEERVRRWADATPDSFRFCVKAPRTVTHASSLDGNLPAMMEFLDVVQAFGAKLGVVLLQFPPHFGVEERPALERFLGGLPAQVRFAVEFRNSSWHNEPTAELLRRRTIAWVFADYSHDIARLPVTSDFLYLRWVGRHHRFRDMNREEIDVLPRLNWWKKKLDAALTAAPVRTLWGFFNNDFSGYSVAACNHFKRLLALPVAEPDPDAGQGLLFTSDEAD